MPVFVDTTTLRPGQRPVMPKGEIQNWLAGKTGKHIPSATTQTSMVVHKVIQLLDQSRVKTHFSSSEHFNRTLRLWEAATRRAEMGEWLELCVGMERGLEPLSEALWRLIQHATYSYEDALGNIYMALELGDHRKGQYFTPFPAALMMAEMTLHDWLPRFGPGGPPASFYEPACGSGVMFLATMQVLEERFPGVLERGLVQFTGNDIDPTAVLMATLNLRLRGYPRVPSIRQWNALASVAAHSTAPVCEELQLQSAPLTATADASYNEIPAPDPDPLDQLAQYLFF